MTLPRIPFLALLLLGSVLALVPSLHAGGSNKNGNPFGNGTFFGNSGTFSGVIRGQNLAGITQFTTSSTNALTANNGTTFIDIEGFSYSSGVAATLDPSAGTLNAFFSTVAQTGGGGALLGGGFLGTLQNSYPNQTFNGAGTITATNPTLATNFYPIAVNGVRVSQ
jgi:hypothetical protein